MVVEGYLHKLMCAVQAVEIFRNLKSPSAAFSVLVCPLCLPVLGDQEGAGEQRASLRSLGNLRGGDCLASPWSVITFQQHVLASRLSIRNPGNDSGWPECFHSCITVVYWEWLSLVGDNFDSGGSMLTQEKITPQSVHSMCWRQDRGSVPLLFLLILYQKF